MSELILAEIHDRRLLAQLCNLDSKLGFHPEAEVYLYDSGRLVKSIANLEKLLVQAKSQHKRLKCPERPSYKNGSGWCCCKTFRWRIDPLEDSDMHLTVEVTCDNELCVFEFAASDPFVSEPVRFLTWNPSSVMRDHLQCRKSKWTTSKCFEAEFRLPYPENAFSISCAIGPHDFETMLDAWPARPGDIKPKLRLELRYFIPGYTGLLI